MASKDPVKGAAPASAKRVSAPKVPAKSAAPAIPLADPLAEPTPPLGSVPLDSVIAKAVAIAAAEPAAAVAHAAPEIVKSAAKVETTINKTAQAATATASKEIGTMATTFENSVNKGQAFFADINERTKAAVEKSTKVVEDINEFNKGNIEAIVESGRITAKGLETLGQDAADYGRRSFESATAALKNFASAKTPADFFKLQSEFVRASFDSYVAEASKGTEAFIKLAGDAAQPLSNRVAVAMDKAKASAPTNPVA